MCVYLHILATRYSNQYLRGSFHSATGIISFFLQLPHQFRSVHLFSLLPPSESVKQGADNWLK